jgi:SAM-dependent methyltransferase
MNQAERQHVIDRYAERLGRLGPVVQALGWRDQAQQELRFRVMADGMRSVDGASVLDVGCGFGDFYDYLTAAGHDVRYTGCDLSPDVLAVARERHPELTFEQRDILDRPHPSRSFDYVCMSGIFNHRISDNDAFLRAMLAAAFDTCSTGVVSNMTTSYVDYQDAHLYYFSPEDVFRQARTLSKRVALRHDYPLYEFTLFIYRDDTP